MAESAVRPNIRIEIHNNLVEKMDVEEAEEEGEINDSIDVPIESTDETAENPTTRQRVWPNTNGGFTTGINIFDKEEQSKLEERAKRFALKPDEINNFTEEQLQMLRDSLGITSEDEKDIRLEAIHVRGTDEMSTGDVLEYFGKYGPAAIEWIDDTSCNVLWNDRISAARALFFLSKAVKGMPVEGPRDPFVKELNDTNEDKENTGRSILLKNNDREVELKDDTEEEENPEIVTASIADISIPIPPGYWRLGVECGKSKCILLRFAYKSDKKPQKAEKFSEYYKKHGNPNYGGLKGLISETHKKKFRGIFDRNKEFVQDVMKLDPKNPWGNLALHWHEDLRYCEKIPTDNAPITINKGKSDIMNRLGFKRSLEDNKDNPEEADKKSKVPRMRMYADEEEEKIKRKKELQKLKQASSAKVEDDQDDLRNILNTQSRKNTRLEKKEDEIEVDLGTRLKNRSRKLEKEIKNDKIDDKSIYQRREFKERYRRSDSLERYERRMYSDRNERKSRKPHRRDYSPEDFVEPYPEWKTKSKIAVVIKKQKAPTVASTVSRSRVDTEHRGRLKTISERRYRREEESSSGDSSDSSSSSTSSSSSSEDDSSDSDDDRARVKEIKAEKPEIPKTEALRPLSGQKNLLRIEISNDHFKK